MPKYTSLFSVGLPPGLREPTAPCSMPLAEYERVYVVFATLPKFMKVRMTLLVFLESFAFEYPVATEPEPFVIAAERVLGLAANATDVFTNISTDTKRMAKNFIM